MVSSRKNPFSQLSQYLYDIRDRIAVEEKKRYKGLSQYELAHCKYIGPEPIDYEFLISLIPEHFGRNVVITKQQELKRKSISVTQ